MRKIVIIGSCGSGKTTVGKQLATQLNIPFTDLDDLFWLPHWGRRSPEAFTTLIEEVTRGAHGSFAAINLSTALSSGLKQTQSSG